MPPQTSIARSVAVRLRGSTSGGCSASGSSAGAFPVAIAGLAQHEGSSDGAVEQQEGLSAGAFATVGIAQATRRWSAVSTAGSTRCVFAHASVSAGEWQQQLVKHRSAVSQPQALSMQGNGRDRSLPASRFAAGDAGSGRATLPTGNGSPEATTA
jgi:hypothetical protein